MSTNRPKIKVPLERIDIILELIVLALVLLTWGYVITSYSQLPEIIPSHFNAKGEVDGYSGKNSIWFLAILTTVLAAGMHVLTKFPQIHNYTETITEDNALFYYRKSARMLRFVNIFTTLVFVYVVYSVIESAKGKEIAMQSSFIYIIIMFSVIMPIFLLLYMSRKKNNKV